MNSSARLLIALGLITIAGAASAGFFDKLIPNRPIYETFEGKFIDRVWPEAGPQGQQRKSGSVFGRVKSMFSGGNKAGAGEADQGNGGAQTAPRFSGLTFLRSDGDGILPPSPLDPYLRQVYERIRGAVPVASSKTAAIHLMPKSSYDAYATPDGFVGIPVAVLNNADSEDEIAALLAHELSHILLEHHGPDWIVEAQERSVNTFEVVISLSDKVLRQVSPANAELDDLRRRLRYAMIAKELSSGVIFPQWKRSQEQEADLLGMDLLLRAGYHPQGMFDLLEKIGASIASEGQRRAALEAELEGLGSELEGDMQQGRYANLRQDVTETITKGFNSVRNSLRQTHPSVEKRLAALSAYLEREYGDVEFPEPSARWQRVRKQPTEAIYLNGYTKSFDARRALFRGSVQKAATALRPVLHTALAEHTYVRRTAADIRRMQARPELARVHLERAIGGPEPGLAAYVELAELYGSHGHIEQAKAQSQTAWEKFDHPPQVMPKIVHWTRQGGDEAEAESLALRCHAEFPGISKACQEAAKAPVVRVPVRSLAAAVTDDRFKGTMASGGFETDGLSRQQIARFQTLLNVIGFPTGVPDGLIGRNTRKAVKLFQVAQGLPPTGRFDTQTTAALSQLADLRQQTVKRTQ